MTATPRPLRLLYLAFYFPPSRASGVFRARATANHFAAQGWDVTVLAAPMRFLYGVIGSVDEDLATTIDSGIRIERPAMNYYPWESDLREFGRFRANLPLVARKLYLFTQSRVFPERYASWGAAALARGLRLHARHRFDLVLATGNPFASFAVAWAMHRLSGVPYALDYRDSWTLNQFDDTPSYPEGHPAGRWERRVLREAAAVTFVNAAQRSWHAGRYPESARRMLVVPNGWDADLLPYEPPTPRAESAPLRFSFLGTVTNGQPIEALAAAFDVARRAPGMAGAELNVYGHLGFFQGAPAVLKGRLESGTAGSVIRYRGPVAKSEVPAVYHDSDVLVFMTAGGRYVTTGKVFEYMATGRPIVSVHDADIAANEVLDGYPLWFNPGGLDVESVAKSMVAAGMAARELTAAHADAARAHAEAFERDRLLEPVQRLMALIARRGRRR